MLNGIGGRTIEEAKERLTYEEFLMWCAYIKKHGSLHVGRRLEYGFGMVAMLINRACGGNKEMADFMPHYERPSGLGSIGDVMKILSGGK